MGDQLDEYRRQMQQRYQGKAGASSTPSNSGQRPPAANPLSTPSHPPSAPARNLRHDEELAHRLQEEEKIRREDQLRQDEELARKLQGSYGDDAGRANPYGTPVYPPQDGYRPPGYIPAGQPVPPPPAGSPYGQPPNPRSPYVAPYSGNPANQGNPANPPPYNPQQYPPASYQAYRPPSASNPSRSQSGPAQNQSTGCLPNVQDKCLGINTQVCVLASAALMTIGIIATLIGLSA